MDKRWQVEVVRNLNSNDRLLEYTFPVVANVNATQDLMRSRASKEISKLGKSLWS